MGRRLEGEDLLADRLVQLAHIGQRILHTIAPTTATVTAAENARDGGEYTVTAAGYPPKATHLTVHGSGVESHDIELSHPSE